MTKITLMEYGRTGKSTTTDELGMRPMQARAWERRGEPYLLIKSPPASGKSRAVMYIALDKLNRQKLRKVIVTVPQAVIGASFAAEKLTESDFTHDWKINPKWDLCDEDSYRVGNGDTPDDGVKVKKVGKFLESESDDDRILLCAHATFRRAVDKLGLERFDNCLVALDEVHHASSDKGANVLGMHLSRLIERGKAHIIAMTGTFFRGDAVPVLSTEDEMKFETVVYTGYEQLEGYDHLKSLIIDHTFFNGKYTDSIMKVVDPTKKTIIYIPGVNTPDATDKVRDVDAIIGALGTELDSDTETGFRKVKCAKTGKELRIADLVNDDTDIRPLVVKALRDRTQKDNPHYVDIVIALNMAKEGFDWIWAEHAVVIGHRESLTDVVQMMGRVTRDAPGKSKARFTNMMRDPEAETNAALAESVNDRMKAIFMGLLMEQVYAPKFKITHSDSSVQPPDPHVQPNDPSVQPHDQSIPPIDPSAELHDPDEDKTPPTPQTPIMHVKRIIALSPEKQEAVDAVIADIIHNITLDAQTAEIMVSHPDDPNGGAREIMLDVAPRVIKKYFPDWSREEREKGVLPRVQVTLVAAEIQRQNADHTPATVLPKKPTKPMGTDISSNTEKGAKLFEKLRRANKDLSIHVTDLDIDLIASIHPFATARRILGKDVNSSTLREVDRIANKKKRRIDPERLLALVQRAIDWQVQTGEFPNANSSDSWESLLGQATDQFAKEQKAK